MIENVNINKYNIYIIYSHEFIIQIKKKIKKVWKK